MNLYLVANEYYHEFHVGFNWCFIVAPLLLLAMVLICWHGAHLWRGVRGYRIRVFRTWVIPTLASLFTTIIEKTLMLRKIEGGRRGG